jgi:uncharacterized protein (TIGR02001 family)
MQRVDDVKNTFSSAQLIYVFSVGLALSALITSSAQAQQAPSAPKNVLVTDLSLASDYRYDGLSSSDRHGAVQGSFYLWRPDKLFAGVFASTVDNGASAEIDLYGGRKFDVGKTHLQLQVLGAFFTDQKYRAFIPTYNFVQTTFLVERPVGPIKLSGSVAWTPAASAGAGEAWRFSGAGEWPAAPWLVFSGRTGQIDAKRGQDRTFWDVGATLTWGAASLDLRYSDTNLDAARCFGSDWCAGGFVTKLTWRLPMARLF